MPTSFPSVQIATLYAVAAACCISLIPNTGQAQQLIRVPGDQPNLQNALNAITDGGTIELAAGTYTAPPGGFKSFPQFDGAQTTKKGYTLRAAPQAKVTLSGENSTEIFIRTESPNHLVHFERITFANGATTTGFIAGGVTLVNAPATFTDCVFENNRADAVNTGGGGVWVSSSSASFVNCQWIGNSSRIYGGGLVATDSRVLLRNCSFSGNRTDRPQHLENAAGGAIYAVNSVVEATGCGFDRNATGYAGGAIYIIGSWRDPESTPTAILRLTDSSFTANHATRDQTVAFADPALGGAIHAEDQANVIISHCRFTGNVARQGGALSLFRAWAEIEHSVLRDNYSTGTTKDEGFGGAIMALSSDFAGNTANHRSISVTVTDSVFIGPGRTSAGRSGGCIYAGGDLNAAFGLSGVPKDGSLESNRGNLKLTRVGIYDYSAVAGGGFPGTGGAVQGNFVDFVMEDSIIANCHATNSGGALQFIEATTATITNSAIADCSAGDLGGGVTMFGGNLNASETRFLRNRINSGRGSAITTAPAPGFILPDFHVTGLVQNCVFSGTTDSTVLYSGDRAVTPFNKLQFGGNQFAPGTGNVFASDVIHPGEFTVAGLNALLPVPRLGDVPTIVVPFPNSASASAPEYGKLLMLPRAVAQRGAPGEALPSASYLCFASDGGEASLNGSRQNAGSGFVATTEEKTHILSVGGGTTSLRPPAGNALNISTRLPVGTGDNVLIGGFIALGSTPKRVIIRAVGPSLGAAGVAGALADPELELHSDAGLIARNNDWRSTQIGGVLRADQTIDIHGSSIPPSNSLEPAIVTTLEPNKPYTALVRGVGNGTGVGLVEVYDLDAAADSRLANISTRGFVQTNDNVMVGGFIYGGGVGATNIVVRGLGPSLGLGNTLSNPLLEIYNGNGEKMTENDNWQDSQGAAIEATGLKLGNASEAAVLLTGLTRGGYTAVLRDANGGTGVGLIEAYVFE